MWLRLRLCLACSRASAAASSSDPRSRSRLRPRQRNALRQPVKCKHAASIKSAILQVYDCTIIRCSVQTFTRYRQTTDPCSICTPLYDLQQGECLGIAMHDTASHQLAFLRREMSSYTPNMRKPPIRGSASKGGEVLFTSLTPAIPPSEASRGAFASFGRSVQDALRVTTDALELLSEDKLQLPGSTSRRSIPASFQRSR